MTTPVILIPAAGASLRMRGADKLMQPVDGESALRRTARIAARIGPTVIVTLPDGGPHAAPRRAEVVGTGARALPIPDAHEGMAASLRAGVRGAGNAEGLMILLPDMPALTEDDLSAVITAWRADPTRAVRATAYDGTPGHPVILPRRLFGEVLVLTGDEGARRVLAGEEVTAVRLPGRHATMDLDTPEDWDDWRSGLIS
jgi:CTP:molybdopterin cytidylyltransferase MocA